MIKRAPKLIISVILLLSSSISLAGDKTREYQIHVRTGLVAGSYQGTFEGSFSVPTALDLEYEIFMKNNQSYYFRFTQVLDIPESRPFYTFAGMGMRFYQDQKGMYSIQSEPGMYISTRPNLRYYFSTDVGVSQDIVKSFGSIVNAVSSMLDIGAAGGIIYQVRDDFGIEAQIGASVGYGFSSTAVFGFTGRFLIGGTYYF